MPKGVYTRNPNRKKRLKSGNPAIYVIGPSVSYIPLSRGLFALVESDDAPALEKKRWNAHYDSKGKRYYAIHRDGKKHVPMHREILSHPVNHVDHKNGNSLDNRKHGNLREATRCENMANRKIHSNNKSGFKGVSVHSCGRYRAQVQYAGVNYSGPLRRFPEEAYADYCAKALELHGEFARLA